MVFLKEAWSTMIDLAPELQDLENNPLFVQIVPPSDMILLITMEARIGDLSGIMNIVYPYVLLEPILSMLSAQTLYAMGTRSPTKESRECTQRVLMGVELQVHIELGRAPCTMRELLSLEKDDIILLHKNVQDNMDVIIGELVKFRCTPGLVGKKRAGQITEVVEEDSSWLHKLATR